MRRGPSTRAVHAGLPAGGQGEPLLPGPVLAAPYHLRGPKDASPYAYGRDANPTWTALERALGDLDGGEAVVFSSGMAAIGAVLDVVLSPGDRLVGPVDGYPGIRVIAEQQRAIDVDLLPSETQILVATAAGAQLVWVETPANPRLQVVDIAAVAEAAHAAGALLAVDNTVATPLGQRPLDLGADIAMLSGTKTLCGHSDVLLGAVSTRDAELAAALRTRRSQAGSIPGPFEAWLAHRSLATLGLRLERSSANALALAEALRARDDVLEVLHPSGDPVAVRQMARFGALVGFTLHSEARAQAFLDACELVAEATSFGGVHSTAERRGRWGTDAVPEGFIRFSAGCEDVEDLLADVQVALDRAA